MLFGMPEYTGLLEVKCCIALGFQKMLSFSFWKYVMKSLEARRNLRGKEWLNDLPLLEDITGGS